MVGDWKPTEPVTGTMTFARDITITAIQLDGLRKLHGGLTKDINVK